MCAVVPIHRVRRWGSPLRELIRLPKGIGLWLWIGGAEDEVIDRIIARSGGLRQLLEVAKRSGFDGVIGIDYTVYLDECSEEDSKRVADAAHCLLEIAKDISIDVVPQVKLCRPRDVVHYYRLRDRIVLYNAIHDLRDGFEDTVAKALHLLSAVGLRTAIAISGYDREYSFLRNLADSDLELTGILTGIRCEHSKWIKLKYINCILDVVNRALEVLEY